VCRRYLKSIFDNLVVRTSQLILSRSLFETLDLKMARATCDRVAQQVEPASWFSIRPAAVRAVGNALCGVMRQVVVERLRKHQLKGLILAQNERWRRGLGMQVAR